MLRKHRIAIFLLPFLCLTLPALAGIGTHDAVYMGGTISAIPDRTEGKPVTADQDFQFQYKKGNLSIPYSEIDSLEYGQKAGRRVGLAVVVNPFFLFSHKRRHYLTIGWTDADKKQQAAVLELGKSVIGPTIRTLEAKSGKKVEYQDEEARKSAKGN